MNTICPTCGEKRHLEQSGECYHCEQTTRLLNGRTAYPGPKNESECGEMKIRPYDTDKASPFE